MKSLRHTAGPWRRLRGGLGVYDSACRLIATISKKGIPHDETLANLRLIESATDLLGELRSAEILLRKFSEMSQVDDNRRRVAKEEAA